MRFSLLFLLSFSLISCHSKLDKKENEPLMLDLKANENLTISPEAFIANAINYDFLKSDCKKITQSRNTFLYVKDSSTVLIQDNFVKEVHLKSVGDFLNYDLTIGKSKADFESTFVRLVNRNASPFVSNQANKIRFSCCTASESVWEFEFEDDVLTKVDFIK